MDDTAGLGEWDRTDAGSDPVYTGVFNNQLIQTLVEEESVRENVITNLLKVVEEKGYVGVDVDFGYVRVQNREGYAEFIGELRAAMNEKGYRVSVALAPKTSSDQKGLLYEGIDYALLGRTGRPAVSDDL